MCRHVERLAQFHPDSVAILTGRRGERTASEARQLVVEGMREVAATARRLNVPLVLEPLRAGPEILVSTIHEAVQLIEEVGAGNVGVLADAWHLWDQPQLRDDVRNHRDRIWAVQLNDTRTPNRGWSDRVLPGDGSIDLIAFVRLMDEFGYSGWYDVEILSGEGTLENEYPDSLWKLDPGYLTTEAVRRVHALLKGARSHDNR
jgi:sugar phosphate isomerase/epimerase